MPEVNEHAPGTFSWAEVGTPDQGAAMKFYTGVFGWEAEDLPIGEGDVYTMFRVRGKDVAASFQQREEEEDVPPHWNSYVTVEDVDTMAKTAESLGGKVLVPPFDVMDQGRMTALQDPSGAVISLWQPKAGIGAQLVYEPGALSWNELQTRDPEVAKRFYTKLFGWNAEEIDMGGGPAYTRFSNGDEPAGGMFKMGEEVAAEVSPYWMVCFAVDDPDAAAAKSEELDGQGRYGPVDSEWGRYAVLRDNQGALFSIIKPPEE